MASFPEISYSLRVTLFMCSNVFLALLPLINNILKPPLSLPTSVAGDEPYGVALQLFDRDKQRGFAGHQYGHVTGRPRQLWKKKRSRKKKINVTKSNHRIKD